MRKSWLPLIMVLCLALAAGTAGAQEPKAKGGKRGKGKKGGGEPGAVQPGAPAAPAKPAGPSLPMTRPAKIDDPLAQKAATYIDPVRNKQIETIFDQFDERVKAALGSPEKMNEMIGQQMAQIEGQVGAFQNAGTDIRGFKMDLAKMGIPGGAELGMVDVRVVPLTFERGKKDCWVLFTDKGLLAGVQLVDSGSDTKAYDMFNQAAKAQAKATAATGKEEQVTIGAGTPWALPGTLTLPSGNGPFPVVLLVHGSGPNDRDETVGANKPFRDLAQGLAAKGVATLRYEKRTKEHALAVAGADKPITVKEEVIDDALAAVALLRGNAKIDKNRIVVLGHSLGGMLLPRIAQGDPAIAGFIFMAGNARPMEDLVLDQTVYLASLNGPPTPEGRKQIAAVQSEVQQIKALQPGKTQPFMFLLGAQPEYWLDLRGYNPPEAAKAIAKPMLFLQGDRDYQVTGEDYRRWQLALTGRPDVTFKPYRGLNHLFILGSGKSIPAEYNVAGQVAQPVIDDIAAWVKALK